MAVEITEPQDWDTFFSFHDYTFKHDIPYIINNLSGQLGTEVKTISTSVFI